MVRMSNSPSQYFQNDTSRKFLQRQIVVHDKQGRGKSDFNNSNANHNEMDIALLVLFGHVLFANQSHMLAISTSPLLATIEVLMADS